MGTQFIKSHNYLTGTSYHPIHVWGAPNQKPPPGYLPPYLRNLRKKKKTKSEKVKKYKGRRGAMTSAKNQLKNLDKLKALKPGEFMPEPKKK